MTIRHAALWAALQLLALIVLTASVFAQENQQDTLRYASVIQQVLANNDRLAAARFMEESSQRAVRGAGPWPDPMLMVGLQNVPTSFKLNEDPMTMRMLGLSQDIPLGGSRGAEKDAARAEAEVSAEMRRMTERDLRAAAQTAYAELYFSRQALQDLVAQYEVLDQVIATTLARLESNQASQDEYLSLQAEKWRAQANLLMYEVEVEKAKYRLNSLRGVAASTAVPALEEPSFMPIPDSATVWFGKAREQSPELRRLRAQAKRYGYSAEVSAGMRWPMLRLTGEYGIRGEIEGIDPHTGEPMPEELEDMFNVGIEFTLPIFSRKSSNSMANSMRAMQESTTAEERQVMRDIDARIEGLHLEAYHLIQTVRLYADRIVPTDEDAFRSALGQYEANRGSANAVLSAVSAIFRDRLALRDYQTQLARTLAQVGTLTEGDPIIAPTKVENSGE